MQHVKPSPVPFLPIKITILILLRERLDKIDPLLLELRSSRSDGFRALLRLRRRALTPNQTFVGGEEGSYSSEGEGDALA